MAIGGKLGASGSGLLGNKGFGEVVGTIAVEIKAKNAKQAETAFERIATAMHRINGALELIGKGLDVFNDAINTYAARSQLMAASSERDFKRVQRAAGGLITEMQAMKFAAESASGTFTLTQREMDLAGKAMLSLQRQGKDMAVVFDAVTEALEEGNINALEKLGIVLGEQAAPGGTIAAHRQAIKELEKEAAKLGSTQETAGEEATKAQVRLGDAISKMKSAFGELAVAMVPLLEKMALLVEYAARIIGWVADQGNGQSFIGTSAADLLNLGAVSGTRGSIQTRGLAVAAGGVAGAGFAGGLAQRGEAARNDILRGGLDAFGRARHIAFRSGLLTFGHNDNRPKAAVTPDGTIYAFGSTNLDEVAATEMRKRFMGASTGGIDATSIGRQPDLIQSGLSRALAVPGGSFADMLTGAIRPGAEAQRRQQIEASVAGGLQNIYAAIAAGNMSIADATRTAIAQTIMAEAASLAARGIKWAISLDPRALAAGAGVAAMIAIARRVAPQAKSYVGGGGRTAPRAAAPAQPQERSVTFVIGDQRSSQNRRTYRDDINSRLRSEYQSRN